MAGEKTKTVQLQKRQEILEKIARLVRQARNKKEARELAVFLAMLAGAIIGRVALQGVPSVEPIIPIAILAGLMFGMKEGFMLGGTAYLISNFFVWGMQGPWTIFQALGGALAGASGGFLGKFKKVGTKELVLITIAGTALFEVIMNLAGPLMGIGVLGAFGLFTIPLYFATSLPFTLAHIATNSAFAGLLSPLLKKWRRHDEFKIVSVSRSDSGRNSAVRMYKSESG